MQVSTGESVCSYRPEDAELFTKAGEEEVRSAGGVRGEE